MYKKIIIASLALAIIAGGAISTVFAGGSVVPENSGSNIVEVDSCVQHNNGITVGKFGGEPYFLASGIRDAGHGLRYYTLFCISDTQYKVDWVAVDENSPFAPDQDPVEPEPTPAPQPQPQFVHMSAFSVTAENPLVLTKDSYMDTESYNAGKSFALIQPNVTQLELRAQANVNANNRYAFAWTSSETDNLKFDELMARDLADNISDTSEYSKLVFPVTEYYTGKYVMIYAFVSNNDGISQVPHMPREVDDIIPMYLYFKKLPVNLPIPLPEIPEVKPKVIDVVVQSCGNSAGGDGLYSACVGDSIKHDTPVLLTVQKYTDDYVVLNVRGANESQISVAKGGYHYITANSGTHLEISYTDTSEKHGAFIQMTEVGIM